MFRCLVIYIERIEYTIFTPGFAIFPKAMILRPNNVCGVGAGSRTFYQQVAARQAWALSAVTVLLLHHIATADNVDRVGQILAQGVPPGVSRPYRALADHGNVSYSTLYYRTCGYFIQSSTIRFWLRSPAVLLLLYSSVVLVDSTI